MAFATTAALPHLANLQSLAFGACKGLGQVGPGTTGYTDIVFSPLKLRTGSSVNADGIILDFLVVSEDGTLWTDDIDPDATTTQHSKIGDASLTNLVTRIGQGQSQISANTTFFCLGFSIVSILGYRPMYCARVIRNLTGGAFSATAGDFSGTYTIQT